MSYKYKHLSDFQVHYGQVTSEKIEHACILILLLLLC